MLDFTKSNTVSFYRINIQKREKSMLSFIILFLILALIAGGLGFGGVAIMSVEIARILFIVFLVLLVFSILMHMLGYSRPRPPIE